MINSNWPRWIVASTSKYFDDNKDTLNFFLEGVDIPGRDTSQDYVEFRLNGPFEKEICRNYWELLFDINILVCSTIDDKDFHKIHKDVGIVSKMFASFINIYRFGDGDDDDQNLLGCAQLETQTRGGGLLINHYGKIDPSLKVVQASVEGTYKLYLEV